jgi:hypothetical protein
VTNELNYDSIELMETTQASFDYYELENPMGERSKDAYRLTPRGGLSNRQCLFDRKLKVEFHASQSHQ